ncbi:Transcription initiation factor TFIID subunit 7 [Smittium culicis]|uniref:Transcription initiation factor TFIID subunit 7 n=1 Tax=Smittium culicis TaxID=133412 RepID=A0A1R1Y350_9FUNG|nr:Transcription initiation factor TFIID subunit 7 [Smittium culicis]
MDEFKPEEIKMTKITLKISNIDNKDRDTERTRSRRNRAANPRSTDSFSKSYKQDYSSPYSGNDNSDFESAKDSRSSKKITTKVKIKKTKFTSEGQDSQDKIDGRTRIKTENFIEFDENVSLSKYKNFNGSSFSEHTSSQLKLESHFIVRVPEEICESVYEIVNKRDIGDKIDITFIDNRRAVFRFEDQLYKAKLVDLPTITESYRTTDKKQILKVADISQMLLVEEKISGFEDEKLKKLLEIRDIAYPHGLAPPLQNVTRRRFRPRISNAKVESIEEEVMRLLQQDENALSISYELFDLSIDAESNIAENETEADAVVRFDDSLEANEDNESVMDLDDFDADLAAELDRGLEELDGEEDANEGGISSNKTYTLEGVVSSSGKNKDGGKSMLVFSSKNGEKITDDEEEDEDEEEEEEDSDDEASVFSEENEPNNEKAMQKMLLVEEVSNLEATIKRKRADLNTAPNPIIRYL